MSNVALSYVCTLYNEEAARVLLLMVVCARVCIYVAVWFTILGLHIRF